MTNSKDTRHFEEGATEEVYRLLLELPESTLKSQPIEEPSSHDALPGVQNSVGHVRETSSIEMT